MRIALLVTLLLVTAAAWRVVSRASARPEPASTTPADAATARIRRARELASEGLDADAVARGSGVSRDVAALLVARRGSDEAAAPGTLFRAKLRRELRPGK